MSHLRLALLVVGALAVGGAAVVTWRVRQARRSPLYSLQRLADAAHDKDGLAVEQYLDVRRVAESVVDEYLSLSTAQAAEWLLQAGLLGSALVGPMIEGWRPSLVTLLEHGIWTALTDSSFTGYRPLHYRPLQDPDSRVRDMLGGSLDLGALAQPYQGIAEVQERNSVARVGVRVRLKDLDSAVVVHLRLERANGYWRVVRLEGLARHAQASRVRTQERAFEASMTSDLWNLVTAQEAYFADHVTYTKSRRALTYYTTSGVSVEIIEATRGGWRAVARHRKMAYARRIAFGTAVPRGDEEGVPKCSPAQRP